MVNCGGEEAECIFRELVQSRMKWRKLKLVRMKKKSDQECLAMIYERVSSAFFPQSLPQS